MTEPTPGAPRPPEPDPYGFGPPPMTPEQERQVAMWAHLVPLILFVLSAGTLGFVGSLVIYLVYRDRGPFVRSHASTSLNFQIMVGIGLIISVPLMFILIGFITYPAICVFAVVVHAIGAMKANQGEWFQAPLTPRMIT